MLRPLAVIFDMDGVLIDSEPLWHKAELGVFRALGVPLDEPMCLETTGLRPDEVVRFWYAKYPWQKHFLASYLPAFLSGSWPGPRYAWVMFRRCCEQTL